MKCFECEIPCKLFYFNIAGRLLCKECASEIINHISDFKVQLNKTRRFKNVKKRV